MPATTKPTTKATPSKKGSTPMSTTKAPVKKTAARRPRTAAKSNEPQHPLHELIPGDKYEYYVSRKIGGVLDLDILAAAVDQLHNVALFGPTGCAKTTCVYAYAHRVGIPVVNVPCNGAADPEMLFGGWRPQPDGSFRLMPGPVYYATRYGPAVVNLDEITMMPPKIAALMFSPLDARRIMDIPEYEGAQGCGCDDSITTCPMTESGKHVPPQLDAMGNPILSRYQVHRQTLFTSTWNPGYAGTYQLNEALLNRFNHKLQFDYSPVVEDQLLDSATLIEFAEKLRAASRNGDITTPVSTNSLIELEGNALHPQLGITYAIENFLSMFKESERESVKETLRGYVVAISAELGVDDIDTDDETPSDDDFDAAASEGE